MSHPLPLFWALSSNVIHITTVWYPISDTLIYKHFDVMWLTNLSHRIMYCGMCSRGKNYQTTCLRGELKPWTCTGVAGEKLLWLFFLYLSDRDFTMSTVLKRVKVIINMPKANMKFEKLFFSAKCFKRYRVWFFLVFGFSASFAGEKLGQQEKKIKVSLLFGCRLFWILLLLFGIAIDSLLAEAYFLLIIMLTFGAFECSPRRGGFFTQIQLNATL